MEGSSHLRHAHSSFSMACAVGIGLGRQEVWIHLRQRSHFMMFGSAESPSPRWHRKHGGASSSGVKGLSVANSGDI